MNESLATALVSSGLPDHEAIRLMSVASGRSRADLLLTPEITQSERIRFDKLVERRVGGEPLQYIEGDVPFGLATIEVNDHVLIPRPETEELADVAADLAHDPAVIVDLCTGSGNLAIALALRFPGATVTGTDLSARAIGVAQSNAKSNGVDVTFVEGDLFDGLPTELAGKVDLLVANPPYLATHEHATLEADVQREPYEALVSGETGFELISRIAGHAHDWLAPGGVVVCEIGSTQGNEALALFRRFAPCLHVDMYGLDRAVVGRMPVE